jgi:hypothetical protein
MELTVTVKRNSRPGTSAYRGWTLLSDADGYWMWYRRSHDGEHIVVVRLECQLQAEGGAATHWLYWNVRTLDMPQAWSKEDMRSVRQYSGIDSDEPTEAELVYSATMYGMGEVQDDSYALPIPERVRAERGWHHSASGPDERSSTWRKVRADAMAHARSVL